MNSMRLAQVINPKHAYPIPFLSGEHSLSFILKFTWYQYLIRFNAFATTRCALLDGNETMKVKIISN